MHTFFSNSLVNHNKFVEVQNQLGLKPSEFVQLSAIRWGYQGEVCQSCHEKPCQPKTIYMMMMFAKLLRKTEGFRLWMLGLKI